MRSGPKPLRSYSAASRASLSGRRSIRLSSPSRTPSRITAKEKPPTGTKPIRRPPICSVSRTSFICGARANLYSARVLANCLWHELDLLGHGLRHDGQAVLYLECGDLSKRDRLTVTYERHPCGMECCVSQIVGVGFGRASRLRAHLILIQGCAMLRRAISTFLAIGESAAVCLFQCEHVIRVRS